MKRIIKRMLKSLRKASASLRRPLMARFDSHVSGLISGTVNARMMPTLVEALAISGLLSGKYSKDTSFAENDHRNYNRNGKEFNVGETFAGLPFEKGVDVVDQLKPLVPAGMTMAQFAMRWILDHEAVTTVIPGATRPEQAAANASASAGVAEPARSAAASPARIRARVI